MVGVSAVTIKTWVSALETSGILYVLPPWFSNGEKRLVKAPKLYFADSGLLCALLGLSGPEELAKSPFHGMIWENFVFTELVKSSGAVPGKNLFFFRDHRGTEMDFVLVSGRRAFLVEAKDSERLRPERLSFDKVSQAFFEFDAQAYVAAPSGETKPLPMAGYTVYDPRFSDFGASI